MHPARVGVGPAQVDRRRQLEALHLDAPVVVGGGRTEVGGEERREPVRRRRGCRGRSEPSPATRNCMDTSSRSIGSPARTRTRERGLVLSSYTSPTGTMRSAAGALLRAPEGDAGRAGLQRLQPQRVVHRALGEDGDGAVARRARGRLAANTRSVAGRVAVAGPVDGQHPGDGQQPLHARAPSTASPWPGSAAAAARWPAMSTGSTKPFGWLATTTTGWPAAIRSMPDRLDAAEPGPAHDRASHRTRASAPCRNDGDIEEPPAGPVGWPVVGGRSGGAVTLAMAAL